MPSSSVRVDDATIARLKVISEQERRPMGQIVTDLIDRYERDRFFQAAREGFAKLREDPVAWKEYQEEADQWLSGGDELLREDAPYYTPEEIAAMELEDE